MQRKVNKIGPSTLMVSLPSKWVKKYNIKKGDVLEVIDDKEYLKIIQGTTTLPSTKVVVDLARVNVSVAWYLLTAAYRSGAEEIEVHLDKNTITDEKLKQEINIHPFLGSVVDNFIGMEIMRNTPTQYMVKEITSVKPEEFDVMLRKIFFSLIVNAEDILNYVQKADRKALEHIYHYGDLQINKFTDYCLRIITKTNTGSTQLYAVILHLEEIGDALKYFAKYAALKGVEKTVIPIITQLKSLLVIMEKFYFAPKTETLVEFEHCKRELRGKVTGINKANNLAIFNITNSINQATNIVNAKLLMEHIKQR